MRLRGEWKHASGKHSRSGPTWRASSRCGTRFGVISRAHWRSAPMPRRIGTTLMPPWTPAARSCNQIAVARRSELGGCRRPARPFRARRKAEHAGGGRQLVEAGRLATRPRSMRSGHVAGRAARGREKRRDPRAASRQGFPRLRSQPEQASHACPGWAKPIGRRPLRSSGRDPAARPGRNHRSMARGCTTSVRRCST